MKQFKNQFRRPQTGNYYTKIYSVEFKMTNTWMQHEYKCQKRTGEK